MVILWCTPRDTFRDAKGWEIPKHHFIHQQRWNSTGRKKKSRWVSPPLLPSFIHLIFILPVEFHGSSHGKSLGAAYSKKGLAGAARRAKARGKSQGMRSRICPGQAPALFEPLALHQCKGSPQRAPKCPSQNIPCSCNRCSPCTSKEKKGIKLATEVKTPSVILLEQEGRPRSDPPGTAAQRGPTGVCPLLINTNYHPWHSAASPSGKNRSRGGLGWGFPSFLFLWCW